MGIQEKLMQRGVFGEYPRVSPHYLCGGKERSQKTLGLIDQFEGLPEDLIPRLKHELMKIFDEDSIYRGVIAQLTDKVRRHIPGAEQISITGGQHWDWFFSYPVSEVLGVRHYFLFKNLDIYNDFGRRVHSIPKGDFLHISGHVQTGSALQNHWIPALKSKGAHLNHLLSVTTRIQLTHLDHFYLYHEQEGIDLEHIGSLKKNSTWKEGEWLPSSSLDTRPTF